MPIFARLRYALYTTILVSMVVMLALGLASADEIRLIKPIDIHALLFHPLYIIIVFGLGAWFAPWLEARLPRKRDWQ